MHTVGKVVDSVVIVASLAVGFGAAKAVIGGVNSKSKGTIALGVLTGLIAIYAIKEAVNNLND